MSVNEYDLVKLYTFLQTQTYLSGIDMERVRNARRREDLGISSLTVIVLVSNYLESVGLSASRLEPEWLPRLDEISGIISVFREIDASAAA